MREVWAKVRSARGRRGSGRTFAGAMTKKRAGAARGRTIVCRVDNTGVHFSNTLCLPWARTNLPAGAFRLPEHRPIYWELAMQSFEAKTLFVVVADYEAAPNSFDPDRQARSELMALHFLPLDGTRLRAQLTYYEIARLARHLLPEEPLGSEPEAAPKVPLQGVKEDAFRRPVRFSVPLLDLNLRNGYATGSVELPAVPDALDFTIRNDRLLQEFDAIKAFFVRRLKRSTVRVSATLRHDDDRGFFLEGASSPDMDRIDDAMIQILRTRSLRDLLNGTSVRSVDKQLFTPEDLFESLEDERLGRATLPDEGLDLLNAILEARQVRNARQLSFLAGQLQAAGEPMRFVLRPQFGFVFLARGQDANHYILELLNSNATYGWSLPAGPKTAAEELQTIETELGKVADLGRQQYRRLLHFEQPFWYIVHEQSEAGVVDGFARWRNRVLERIV